MEALFNGVLSLFCLIALGGYAAKKGVLTKSFNATLSKLLIRIVFPFSLFKNAYFQFQDVETLRQLKYVGISLILLSLGYMLTILIGKILRLDRDKIGVTRAGSLFTNNVFMGLPLTIAFFGEASSLYVVLYFISNTFLFWSIGVYFFDRDRPHLKLSTILCPPIKGFLAGIVIGTLGIELPQFLENSVLTISSAATPFAMLYIGGMFYHTDYSKLKVDKNLIAVIIFKFIIYPLFVIGILYLPIFNSLPVLLKQVFIFLSSMPTMSQIAIVAGERNIHKEYANTIVLMTTLTSIIFVPIIGTIILYIY